MSCRSFEPVSTRREMLRSSAAGFGSVALAAMAAEQAIADSAVNPSGVQNGPSFSGQSQTHHFSVHVGWAQSC